MKQALIIMQFLLLPVMAGAADVEINGVYYSIDKERNIAIVERYPSAYNPSYKGDIVILDRIEYEGKYYEVKEISKGAFFECYELKSVTIPSSVTLIGSSAFLNCSNMTSVHITDIEAWCNIFFINESSNPLNCAHHLFLNGKEIQDLTIPNSVTSIGSSAFYGCSGLTSVTIPNSVTSIGRSAFYGCSGLTSVTIPNSVTSIGSSAFYGCSGLTSVTIPNSVTSIGSAAFCLCSGLTSVTIPNSVTNIKEKIFYMCTGLTSITISNGINYIPAGAFEGCKNLKYVEIPNSVISIGSDAFEECDSLREIELPDSLKSIGSNAFMYSNNLSSIIIPEKVNKIGTSAFQFCHLQRVIVKSLEPEINYSSKSSYVFSEKTFQHAVLYVPIGKKWEAVYGDAGWYMFNNIREMAMEASEVSASRAYHLMNLKENHYMVYDGVNDQVTNISTSADIDESNPSNSWQLVKRDGENYLYNIGAHKFLATSNYGGFILSTEPTAITISESKKGFSLGESKNKKWGFVLNENVQADATLTGLVGIQSERNKSSYYNLNGQRIENPRKGIYIMEGKKIFVE